MTFVETSSTDTQAYLYDLTTQQIVRTFTPPDPKKNSNFGRNVLLTADYALITAQEWEPGFEANNNINEADGNIGLVYVFDRSTGELVHTLRNPLPEANSWFGADIVGDGDKVVVTDGYATNIGGYTPRHAGAYVYDLSQLTRLVDIEVESGGPCCRDR